MITEPEQLGEIAKFCTAIYGQGTGCEHAHWAIGAHGYFDGDRYTFPKGDWRPREFAYPSMTGRPYSDMLAAAAESDVYVNPYLMNGSKRTKDGAVNLGLLHKDWDGTPEDMVACLDKLDAICGFATKSGTPGHLHIYVPLAQPVTADRHRVLLDALADYLPPGCDKGKKAASDMLRPVGTFNHKGRARRLAGIDPDGQSAQVEWAKPPTGSVIDPDALAEILQRDSRPSERRTATNPSNPVPPDTGELPERVRAALALDTGDRSVDTARVIGTCVNAGLTLAQTRAAVDSRPDLAERVAEFLARNPSVDDVRITWDKIVDDRQGRKREQADAEGFNAKHGKTQTASGTTGSGADGSVGSSVPGMKRWKAGDLKEYQQPKFLASNHIPFGAVTILCGDEGIGKSLFWVLIVAAVTTGKPVAELGIPEREPADVILVLTEDDWQTCVLPRLMVAGADLDRIEVICTDDDGTGSPIFPDNMDLIIDADPKPALVVVDAWLDTVPAKLQIKDAQQSRLGLHPWREAAGKTGAAVLLLTHSNRLATASIRDKYGATASLRQKARMTLYALQDPQDGTLIVGPDKANNAPMRTKASRFRILAEVYFNPSADHDGTVPSLQYAGSTGKSIKQHLAELADAEQRKTRRRGAAETWLIGFLADGPRKSTDVLAEGARAEGEFSRDQLRRAKDKVGRSFKDTGGDCWWWELLPENVPANQTDEND